MEKEIKLYPKDDSSIILKKLNRKGGKESTTYIVKLTNNILYVGINNEGKKYLNPVGGPTITVDSVLEGTDYIVKSIDFISGIGYTITLKE